ncbi:MAG: signal peptidase [Bacteroidota bacterium]
MKTLRKLLLTLTFLFTSMFIFNGMADEPLDNPPPPPGGGHGGGGNSQGAPIDGGLSILLVLGAGYGAKKLYKSRKEKRETTSDEVTE